MSKIELGNTIIRDPKTASRIIDDEAIVLTPADSKIHSINEVGSRIWELLENKPQVTEIVTVICDEFDVDQETAQKDIITFLEGLLERGMITIDR